VTNLLFLSLRVRFFSYQVHWFYLSLTSQVRCFYFACFHSLSSLSFFTDLVYRDSFFSVRKFVTRHLSMCFEPLCLVRIYKTLFLFLSPLFSPYIYLSALKY
jgi:hypothetical protein